MDWPPEILTQIEAYVEGLSPEIREEARKRAHEKGQVERMLPYFEAVSELANTVALIPSSTDPEERYKAYLRLYKHIEKILHDSIALLRGGSLHTSLFLSIVAIEELGKASVAILQAMMGVPKTARPHGGGTERSVRSHRDKHYLAAASGAVINARMDRVLGIKRVLEFVKDAESGALEQRRQSALYYDFSTRGQYLPSEAISHEVAVEHLVIALELFAEISPPDPGDWEESIKWISAIEREFGYNPDKED